MTLDESVHGMRLRVIERAQVQGNVSAVCRELGISRTVFYRWRQRLERYGVDGVHPRRQRARAGRPVAMAPEVERLVLGIAISAATWGADGSRPTWRGPGGYGWRPAPDDLVRAREQRRRDREPERLRCLEVDHQLELGRLLDGKITGLGACEDLVDEDGGALPDRDDVRPSIAPARRGVSLSRRHKPRSA